MRESIARALAVTCIAVQGGILDYYIVHYNGQTWLPWITTDVVTILFLFLTYWLSEKYVKKVRVAPAGRKHSNPRSLLARRKSQEVIRLIGILPLVYAGWFVYSSCLVMKICVIFKTFGPNLLGEGIWGTNLLEFVITGTAGIFAFMVAGRAHPPSPSQRTCLNFMQHHVLIEIIDCMEFLTILFVKEHHLHVPEIITELILGFACANLVLPTIGLYQLSSTNFSRKKPKENFYIIQTILSSVFGNVPYLVIRVYLWSDHEFTNALFVMKNIIMLGQNVKELRHYFCKHGGELPKALRREKLANGHDKNLAVPERDDV